MPDGEFSGAGCTADLCAPTETPNSNSSVAGSISGTTGEVVQVTCDEGYSGGGDWICGTDGEFVALPCVANSCSNTQVSNSSHAASGMVAGKTGERVEVLCNAGYVDAAAPTLTPPSPPMFKWWSEQGEVVNSAIVCMRFQVQENGVWGPLSATVCSDYSSPVTALHRPVFWPPNQLHATDSIDAFRWWRVGSPEIANDLGSGQGDNQGCVYSEQNADSIASPANPHPHGVVPQEETLSASCSTGERSLVHDIVLHESRKGNYLSLTCGPDQIFSPELSRSCTNVDECSLGTVCADNATCGDTQGSFTCTCKPGYFGDGARDGTGCTACPAGQKQPLAGQASCVVCPVGESQPNIAQTECIPCEAGADTNNQEGQAACTPCAPGEYSENAGTADCSPCAAGSFTDTLTGTGATTCTPCSAGTERTDTTMA